MRKNVRERSVRKPQGRQTRSGRKRNGRINSGKRHFKEQRAGSKGVANNAIDPKPVGLLLNSVPVEGLRNTQLMNIHEPFETSPVVIRGMDAKV